MKATPLRILSLCAAALLSHGAGAVDFSSPARSTRAAAPAAAVDKLGNARALIAAKQWPAALDELRRVNDAGSADWNVWLNPGHVRHELVEERSCGGIALERTKHLAQRCRARPQQQLVLHVRVSAPIPHPLSRDLSGTRRSARLLVSTPRPAGY